MCVAHGISPTRHGSHRSKGTRPMSEFGNVTTCNTDLLLPVLKDKLGATCIYCGGRSSSPNVVPNLQHLTESKLANSVATQSPAYKLYSLTICRSKPSVVLTILVVGTKHPGLHIFAYLQVSSVYPFWPRSPPALNALCYAYLQV